MFQLLIGVHKLLRHGAKEPEYVPMSVIGSPRRGKTTFIKTLIEQREIGWKGRTKHAYSQSGSHQPKTPVEGSAEDLHARTAGVEVKTIELPGGEKFRASDFAGHLAFLMSHHHFLANEHGFYLALLDALSAFNEMLEEAVYWIRFILATRPVRYGLPRVVVAFSHGDLCGEGGSDRAQRALHRLCADFHGLVQFPQEKQPFLLDCRTWNEDMESLVQELQRQHNFLREVRA